MRSRRILGSLVCLLLLGLSPLAADSFIQRGTDVFTTMGNGKTFYDFAYSPIPAGFFCKSSKAFTGRVAFKGLPLATETPGQLEGGDTVIERLDDAVFDTQGVARTRIQFRALSLVSIAPIKTGCGAFHAYVSLAGRAFDEQGMLQRVRMPCGVQRQGALLLGSSSPRVLEPRVHGRSVAGRIPARPGATPPGQGRDEALNNSPEDCGFRLESLPPRAAAPYVTDLTLIIAAH